MFTIRTGPCSALRYNIPESLNYSWVIISFFHLSIAFTFHVLIFFFHCTQLFDDRGGQPVAYNHPNRTRRHLPLQDSHSRHSRYYSCHFVQWLFLVKCMEGAPLLFHGFLHDLLFIIFKATLLCVLLERYSHQPPERRADHFLSPRLVNSP